MILLKWIQQRRVEKRRDGEDDEEQKPLQSPAETPGPDAGDYSHPGVEIPGETESPNSSQL